MDNETIEEFHRLYLEAQDNRLTEFNARWYSVQHWIPKYEPVPLPRYVPVALSRDSFVLRVAKAIDANIQQHIVQLGVTQLFANFWSMFTILVQTCENGTLQCEVEKFLFWISQLPYIDLDPDTLKTSFCKLILKKKNLAFLGVITSLPDFIRLWAANINIFARHSPELVPSNAESLNLCVRATLGGFRYLHGMIREDSYLTHQYFLVLDRMSFCVNWNAETSFINNSKYIGRGANGSVRKAEFDGKTYAIKSVHLFTGMSAQDEEKAVTEHYIGEFINLLFYPHPNIVKYFHCFLNTNATIPPGCTEYSKRALDFVFEFCDNGSLSDFMKKLPDYYAKDSALVDVACSMLCPLVFLHSYNIVHRDIKPANFLVNSNKTCKLADLGESVHKTYEKDAGKRSSTCTPSYTAPELSHAGNTDASYSLENGDIWGLGCVLYTIALKHNPFGEKESRKLPPPPLPKNHKFIEKIVTCMNNQNWKNRLSAAQSLGYFYTFKIAPHDCTSLETCNDAKKGFAVLQSGVFAHPRSSVKAFCTSTLHNCLLDPLYIQSILYFIARTADYYHLIDDELVESVLCKATIVFQSLSNFSKLQYYLIILSHLEFGSLKAAFPEFLWREDNATSYRSIEGL